MRFCMLCFPAIFLFLLVFCGGGIYFHFCWRYGVLTLINVADGPWAHRYHRITQGFLYVLRPVACHTYTFTPLANIRYPLSYMTRPDQTKPDQTRQD